MANIKSQIKRNRQNEVRRMRNKSKRSELKTFIKRVETAVEAGDRAAAEQAFHDAQVKLDKAAGKGIIKANKAANKKSRLAARVNAL